MTRYVVRALLSPEHGCIDEHEKVGIRGAQLWQDPSGLAESQHASFWCSGQGGKCCMDITRAVLHALVSPMPFRGVNAGFIPGVDGDPCLHKRVDQRNVAAAR